MFLYSYSDQYLGERNSGALIRTVETLMLPGVNYMMRSQFGDDINSTIASSSLRLHA